MDREIGLKKVKECIEEKKPFLQKEFLKLAEEQKEKLVSELYEGMKHLDKQYPIRILQFQIMRADIYQGDCYITVCGYDKDWYLDEKRTEYKISAKYLYQPFQELEEHMKKEISIYLGGVSIYDIRNIICEYFIECFVNLADTIQEKFYLFDEWARENEIIFEAPYYIVWGEYRGITKTLFYQGKLGKTKEDIQKELEENKEKQAYLFGSWVESNLTDMVVIQQNFAHLNMKNSSLNQVKFHKCMFARAMFQNSVAEWCSYEKSILNGCNFNNLQAYQLDFSNAQIENCSFEGIKLRKGRFDGAVLTDVAFTDGTLEECSFQNGKLCRVDLRAEKLMNIDFTGAELEQVFIYGKHADKLKLTPKQQSQVYILEEELGEIL